MNRPACQSDAAQRATDPKSEIAQRAPDPKSEIGYAPFVADLLARSQEPRDSFHMPGHKHGVVEDPQLEALWGDRLFGADLSEIGGVDNLHAPTGALAEAQALAARLWGADETHFLVNGSTAGNHAALLATVRPGGAVVLPRASHRSVFAALMLSDAKPVYVPPLYHPDVALPLGADLSRVAKAVRSVSPLAAVHVTAPNYYGYGVDVAAWADLAHAHEAPLIVDEAHGSHFAFLPGFPDAPRPALRQGADLAVQSIHKTLGSLYQSSMLHSRRGRVDPHRLQQALAMLQSSSPSSLLLASLDAARARLSVSGPALLSHAVSMAEEARERIRKIPGLWCYGRELVGRGGVTAHDPTKVLVRVADLGTTGFGAAEWLAGRHRIEAELADGDHALFSITLADTEDGIQRLIAGLESLSRHRGELPRRRSIATSTEWPAIPTAILGLREAFFAPAEPLPLREAVGRVAAEPVIPYPPGIPALLPGEVIDGETVDFLESLVAGGASIVGASDRELREVRVVRDA